MTAGEPPTLRVRRLARAGAGTIILNYRGAEALPSGARLAEGPSPHDGGPSLYPNGVIALGDED